MDLQAFQEHKQHQFDACIVLLYYFLGMNDREISELLDLIRETVQYRRTSSLKQLQQYLEGKDYGKE